MTGNLLLFICLVLITISYLKIIFMNIKFNKIKVKNLTGFDLAKELTDNYNEINIVEVKDKYFGKYNLKRNIIRLTEKDYNNSDIPTLTKISFLSGYSLLNINKDKNINYLQYIFSNIDYLNKSSLIALIASFFTNTKGDAKITIILLIIILIYQYLINQISLNSKEETKKGLIKLVKKDTYKNIEKIQNTYLSLNKISFITTLILLLRLILLIIK